MNLDSFIGLGTEQASEKAFVCRQHYTLPRKIELLRKKMYNNKKSRVIVSDIDGTVRPLSMFYRGSPSYLFWNIERIVRSDNMRKLTHMYTLTHNSLWEDIVGNCRFCAWKSFAKRWQPFRRYLQNEHGICNYYMIVIEPTDRYYPHFHVLMDGKYLPIEDLNAMHREWGAWHKYEQLRSLRNAIGYAVKYVTKTGGDVKYHSFLSVLNIRQFNTSKGLLLTYDEVKELVRQKSFYNFHGITNIDLSLFSEFQVFYPSPDRTPDVDWYYIAGTSDYLVYGKKKVDAS